MLLSRGRRSNLCSVRLRWGRCDTHVILVSFCSGMLASGAYGSPNREPTVKPWYDFYLLNFSTIWWWLDCNANSAWCIWRCQNEKVYQGQVPSFERFAQLLKVVALETRVPASVESLHGPPWNSTMNQVDIVEAQDTYKVDWGSRLCDQKELWVDGGIKWDHVGSVVQYKLKQLQCEMPSCSFKAWTSSHALSYLTIKH